MLLLFIRGGVLPNRTTPRTPTVLFISYFSKNETKQNINKNDKKREGKRKKKKKAWV